MMKRRIGLQAMNMQKADQEKKKEIGQEVQQMALSQMKERIQTFREQVAEFAQKYKKKINSDPEFRHYFSQMCQKMGVNPLASQKGFLSDMLGVGDFYFELAVQIMEICFQTRKSNGGLIDIDELFRLLQDSRKRYSKNAVEISKQDILQAVKSVSTLGSEFQIQTFSNKTYIQSVPLELSSDQRIVLELAQEKINNFFNKLSPPPTTSNANFWKFIYSTKENQDFGYLTVFEVEQELKWNLERIEKCFEGLVKEGMVWVDEKVKHEEKKTPHYWFISLIQGALSVKRK